MLKQTVSHNVQNRPIVALIATFLAWKFIILLVALLSPGIGYDTSTDLFIETLRNDTSTLNSSTFAAYLANKLTRWDALYFVAIAARGHLYEQEWAFAWGFPKLVTLAVKLISRWVSAPLLEILAAVLVANASHLLSVIVLFSFCKILNDSTFKNKSAFIVACLHIFAPAGIFLSAPNPESLFSCLTFSGYFCYARSFPGERALPGRAAIHDVWLIASSFLFGCACLVRSNGLFNGLIYALDLIILIPNLFGLSQSSVGLRYIASLIISGLVVAAGFTYPQYLAYLDFCYGKPAQQPWCRNLPPSIYLFVQRRYWNVGFLRYWTLPNLPLFLLAAPMLIIMFKSAIWIFGGQISSKKARISQQRSLLGLPSYQPSLLTRIALPQIVLALLALTNFHVQIITRLSSAYPALYLWIFQIFKNDRVINVIGYHGHLSKWIFKWMVIYALLQGGLFASFLPPA